jgi:hypothetical protein
MLSHGNYYYALRIHCHCHYQCQLRPSGPAGLRVPVSGPRLSVRWDVNGSTTNCREEAIGEQDVIVHLQFIRPCFSISRRLWLSALISFIIGIQLTPLRWFDFKQVTAPFRNHRVKWMKMVRKEPYCRRVLVRSELILFREETIDGGEKKRRVSHCKLTDFLPA